MRCIEKISGEGKWQQRWALGLINDLGAIRRNLTAGGLSGEGMMAGALGFGGNDAQLDRFHQILQEVEAEEPISLAGLSVAIQQIRYMAK